MEQAASAHTMTSRERVLAAIHGRPVDRALVTYWPTPHTACHLTAEQQPGRSDPHARPARTDRRGQPGRIGQVANPRSAT